MKSSAIDTDSLLRELRITLDDGTAEVLEVSAEDIRAMTDIAELDDELTAALDAVQAPVFSGTAKVTHLVLRITPKGD